MEIFKLRLIKQRKAARSRRDAINSANKSAESGPTAHAEETKEEEEAIECKSEDHQLDVSDADLGLETGTVNFCYAYYQAEYKELRQAIIRETFRDLTGKWNRNFVVFPLSPCDDINLLL